MAAKHISSIDLDALDRVSGGSPCRGFSGDRWAARSYHDVDFGGPSASVYRGFGGYNGGSYGSAYYRTATGYPYGSYQDMAMSPYYVVDDTGWG